ncbi:host-nuclease inhibitor protein Gam [Salmonella enterica]|uniref:Host-nuclease inhibitor protein Gam n=2 Tax=Salmonella enterica TaxID=28901 RepID=A0A748FHD1_SALER|nr:host-nuclease inhibitor protein Gam [Salmonella enterica]EBU7430755.1 host-nuclease inhibitor protein Gam [Salmonella enterica subsp. enterica serovar Kottbus]EBY1552898.1 host-nuclease inhibitor protein Gam [Salmonella enterica subsp. enterica serovar Hofit]ECZ9689936.1 host-nuclease inhibitor protein Gam [Salmonella enterica subsp. enterica serovar Potsdam]EDL3627771.1 host-nuclease inhibitor protein Gam [Salmonella enterica subsp. enterica serovar Newport]EDQ9668329.1 host-nuclease inhib
MAAKTKRIKSAAAVYVPQNKEDVIGDIKKIGDLQRELEREQTIMNDAIGAITEKHAPGIEALKRDIDTLSQGIQGWCEAHRDELTQNGKTKTASLITGKVEWRNRPPSVGIRGVETVLETLHRLNLDRFIRIKEEVNKDAILNEPEVVKGVAGITIRSGIEDFSITPFEQDTGA